MRLLWFRSDPARFAVKAQAKVAKGLWKCAQCQGTFEKVEIDHIEEVGKFDGDWTTYINRLFCPIDNLRCLCPICHLEKTNKNKDNNK